MLTNVLDVCDLKELRLKNRGVYWIYLKLVIYINLAEIKRHCNDLEPVSIWYVYSKITNRPQELNESWQVSMTDVGFVRATSN